MDGDDSKRVTVRVISFILGILAFFWIAPVLNLFASSASDPLWPCMLLVVCILLAVQGGKLLFG